MSHRPPYRQQYTTFDEWFSACISDSNAYRLVYERFLRGLFKHGLRGCTPALCVRIFNTLPQGPLRDALTASRRGPLAHVKEGCIKNLFNYYLTHYLEGDGVTPVEPATKTKPETKTETNTTTTTTTKTMNTIEQYSNDILAKPTLVLGVDIKQASEQDLRRLIEKLDEERQREKKFQTKASGSSKAERRIKELDKALEQVTKAYDASK